MAVDARAPVTGARPGERPPSIVAPLRENNAGLSEEQRVSLERLARSFIHPRMPAGLANQITAKFMDQVMSLGPDVARSIANTGMGNTGAAEQIAGGALQGQKLLTENGHETRSALVKMLHATNAYDGKRPHLIAALRGLVGAGWPGMGEKEAAARRRRLIALQDAERTARRLWLPEDGDGGASERMKSGSKPKSEPTKSAGKGPRGSSRAYSDAGMGPHRPHATPDLPARTYDTPGADAAAANRADLAAGRAADRRLPVPGDVVADAPAAAVAPVTPPRRAAAVHAPAPAG